MVINNEITELNIGWFQVIKFKINRGLTKFDPAKIVTYLSDLEYIWTCKFQTLECCFFNICGFKHVLFHI